MVYTRNFGDYEERFEGTPEEIVEVINSLEEEEEKEKMNSETEELRRRFIYHIMMSRGVSVQTAEGFYKFITSC